MDAWLTRRRPSCGRRSCWRAARWHRRCTTPRPTRCPATWLRRRRRGNGLRLRARRLRAGVGRRCSTRCYGADVRVLLPVARHDADGPAAAAAVGRVPARRLWCRPGSDCGSRRSPGCPPTALADATVVFVPALAVDRAGVRLGRGAGFYDRSLPLAAPAARLVAVVRDDELVDEVPAEPHDVRDDARADAAAAASSRSAESAARQHRLPSPASRSRTPTARRRP